VPGPRRVLRAGGGAMLTGSGDAALAMGPRAVSTMRAFGQPFDLRPSRFGRTPPSPPRGGRGIRSSRPRILTRPRLRVAPKNLGLTGGPRDVIVHSLCRLLLLGRWGPG